LANKSPLNKTEFRILQQEIDNCVLCPRLVAHREAVAVTKRRAYLDWNYWGKPVPSFGNQNARLLVVGLAPGAHGANRTGRMFTGDSSGDFLYRALHAAGFANQPTSTHAKDGLHLRDCYITAAAHCVPPDNKPMPTELVTCNGYLRRELQLLTKVEVVVALGRIAFEAYLTATETVQRPKFVFGHGATFSVSDKTLIASYHPSQQNTSTRRLTAEMLQTVFDQAAQRLKNELR
jgi:uracil-DNA glycosylase